MTTVAFLPPELEREIFEETALMHKAAIPNLILVARRVLPLLYRVVCVGRPPLKLAPAILTSAKPPVFFYNAVRHLALLEPNTTSKSKKDDPRLLELCRGVVSFGAYNKNVSGAALARVEHMDLRRLSLCVSLLFDRRAVDFTHPIFRSLTHLDMFDSVQDGVMELLPFIPTLPALTHLTLGSSIPRGDALEVLARSLRLQLLLVLWLNKELHLPARVPHVYDVRFVTGVHGRYWETWEARARGLPDLWSLGADFVARKRRGEIEGIVSPIYLLSPPLTQKYLSNTPLANLRTCRTQMNTGGSKIIK
ncbi:hypothetical protein B0H16DRAFT_1411408 [Mycena metata]|uniref:Uncharacterized protein n=1 Tax=Mycena metata TaxID=1033252 RepID=A0AAD7NNB3_9AGAR|nr:hypothetical protein B0H16DRAFT_1411408 [Mycena metata]